MMQDELQSHKNTILFEIGNPFLNTDIVCVRMPIYI